MKLTLSNIRYDWVGIEWTVVSVHWNTQIIKIAWSQDYDCGRTVIAESASYPGK